MRFNCGLSLVDRWEASVARRKRWHAYFTLLPRRIDDTTCVWLETIERKGELHCVSGKGGPHSWWMWEYRLPVTEGASNGD